jgi:hypothetical protein
MPYQWSDLIETLPPLPESTEQTKAYTGHLAGSRFNQLVTCSEILAALGWNLVRQDRNGDEHWHSPHSSQSADTPSATVYGDDGFCAVWSETVAAETGIPTRSPRDAFGLWTWLVFHGDFVKAHGHLTAVGITDLTANGSPKPSEASGSQPRMLLAYKLSEIKARQVEWIWPGWLPAGKLVICDGDPDAGKSTMLLDLTSRITNGAKMPDGSGGSDPAGVILLAGEDDVHDTIINRLNAAAADLDRVHFIDGVTLASLDSPFDIPTDLDLLEAKIRLTGARLVIVDVLAEYLSARVDTYKDSDIRRTLRHVRQVAGRTGCAIVMLRHLRKEGGAKAIYRGGGSIGIVGAARAGWLIGVNPDDESMRVLACTKSNLMERPQALGFRLTPHDQLGVAYVTWTGPVALRADDLGAAPKAPEPSEDSVVKVTEIEFCMSVLRQILADGERWSHEVLDEIKEWHFNNKTVQEARNRLGVVARQVRRSEGEARSGWKMRLP